MTIYSDISKFKPRSKEAQRLLSDESVLEVYQRFSDGCSRCFNIDITAHQSPYFTAMTLRQVRAFVLYYGADDAKTIVANLFGAAHEGRWRGEIVGKDIFSSRKRWMADKLLLEGDGQVVEIGDGFGDSDELDAIKAGIKPRLV